MAASLSGAQVAQVAYSAGFRGQVLADIVAIGRRESGWQPGARRTDQPAGKQSGDFGLFQINYKHLTPDFLRSVGASGRMDLLNPEVNARAAFKLWQSGGLSPWSAGPGGFTAGGDPLHGVDRSLGQQAVEDATSRGLLGTPWSGQFEGGGSDGGASTNGGAAQPGAGATAETAGAKATSGPFKLPPDAKVIRTDFGMWAVFDLGGVSLAFDIPWQDGTVQFDESKVVQVENDYMDGNNTVQGGSALELATIGVKFGSFKEMWDAIIGSVMGYNNPAINDPGVLAVIATFAGRQDMEPAELENLLQATEWYQTRTQGELEWNSLGTAEREKRKNDQASRMVETVFQFAGRRVTINDPMVRNYLEEVSSGRMGYGSYTEVIKGLALEDEESPYTRTVRAEEEAQGQRPIDIENSSQRVREMAHKWGIQWSPSTVQQWGKDIVENVKSDEDLMTALRNQAQVLYPWKDPTLDTESASAPWVETYRRVMEKSGTIFTPGIQKALSAGQPTWEFEQDLKKSSEWLSTKNGSAAMYGTISEMGQMMGYV